MRVGKILAVDEERGVVLYSFPEDPVHWGTSIDALTGDIANYTKDTPIRVYYSRGMGSKVDHIELIN